MAQEMYATPRAVKLGPMEFPLHGTMERWPSVIYDVNAYYATLGVSPRASRREIREAYSAKKGWKFERLTYIVKQLLDSEVRRAYDACLPGSRFFDRYMQDYVKSQILADHRQETGRTMDTDEVEAIDWEKLSNTSIVLDGSSESGYPRWRWGFYLWKVGEYDIPLLTEWMRCLCSVYAGYDGHLSVGLMDGEEEVALVTVGYRPVAFINVNSKPSTQLARQLEYMTNG